ncbi:MAG: GGDEF domain-containing protein [Butyrivibrio sp.]|nr:GGDEF domain-containing protein [Butyrivibrio sp.]
MMEWLEFSDIVGISIVIYVVVLALNNIHLKHSAKKGIIVSGIALAVLYTFDMLWYVIYYKCPQSEKTDYILNLVTCIVYLMIPLALSTFFAIYAHSIRKIRHYVGVTTIILLAVMDIINIFYPILFYHENSNMYFKPLSLIMHILCFVAFLILLADMILAKSFDYEDTFLATFVGVTMFIGLLASWINYDLKTLWLGLGISYLLMYLAVSELYNKKDFLSGLPNRNAYEKTIAHMKNNYATIVMIDMNDLKRYNDTMGHAAGDRYIFATSKTLADAYAESGKLFRIGGDEFCLISSNTKEELSRIAEALLKNGKCNPKYGDFPINFAYGIGVREEGDTASYVLKKADEAMYENKRKKERV